MRAQFVLSEIGIGLRRNLTMTIAVIVTVAISLALFGSGLLFRRQVNAMKSYWYDKVEVSVFLAKDVTPAQREAISATLHGLPGVKDVFYESKNEAYVHFKEQFRDSPDLVANVTPDALPESYRVKLSDPRQFDVVASAVSDLPGVDQVYNQRQILKRFFTVVNGFQIVAVAFALIQLIAAGLLISNTIRVSAFNRRRETGIMRLVGASNLYIQLPFLLEGALAGLVGVLLAVVALAGVKVFLVNHILREIIVNLGGHLIGWGDIFSLMLPLLVVGVGLSALASFFTLRRYLRV
ncbi:MAG: permease-like cell division protein FtsX [Frankia sp.]|nr:permease-like cell division protein FtsX [Frankia sp.]